MTGRSCCRAQRYSSVGRTFAAIAGASLLVLLSACTDDAGDGRSAATSVPAALQLAVTPRTGEAPLAVRFDARLVGDAGEDAPCPSLAWDFGNGDVLIAQADGCAEGVATSAFAAEYTYRVAGSYEPFVRILASETLPSGAVQVLVTGPTATPAAAAALQGPTIIIATPRGAPPSETAVAMVAAPLPTEAWREAAEIAPEPTTAPQPRQEAATAAPTAFPTGTAVLAAARLLPADLYYLDAGKGEVWRVPMSGAAPERVVGVDGPVDAYAVSPAGHVATTSRGELRYVVPGGESRSIDADGASAPTWSRDGRALAYAANGVWVYDAVSDARRRLTEAGSPLAWSADGRRLVLRGPDGAPVIAGAADGLLQRLPLPPITVAGWLPDRPGAWLGGAGLHVFAADEPPTLVQLLEERALVAAAMVRPDLRLMALADRGAGPQAHVVDLTAAMPIAREAGPVLDIEPGTSFAWAPDGRTVAVADRFGLALLDTVTGARVSVVSLSARDPQWVVPGR